MRGGATVELLGLFGRGIGGSLSPALHGAALEATGRKGQYMLWDVAPDDLAAAMRGAYLLGARGANVTKPYKQAAAQMSMRLDPWAKRIGAVNVLRRTQGGWEGHNTDAEGFWQPLAALSRPIRTALVLGTGGAALAVCAVLAREGVALRVAGRNREMLGRIRREFDAETIDWRQRGSHAGVDLIVNATTVGQEDDATPLEVEDLPQGAIVYDLIYGRPTRLLHLAQQRGCRTIGGGGMLLGQALLAWRLWFDEEPPQMAMAAALEQAHRTLGRRKEAGHALPYGR
jgi:shikimate dehydrogenase